MKTPTRRDLERLLWSDPATEAFEREVRKMLSRSADEFDGPAERAREVIERVGCERGSIELNHVSDVSDLERCAFLAKGGAIMLLHAAWAAEQALSELQAPKPSSAAPEDPHQLKIGGT